MYSMGTKATRRRAAVHYAAHSLFRGNLTNLMPRSFTFCASFTAAVLSTITFNSCKTVSTSSMALATVNIDKIIKVTSASPYVYTQHNAIQSIQKCRAHLGDALFACPGLTAYSYTIQC